MRFPLEGFRVLDFAVAFSSPLCAMMLGDMGADVIKIEPLEGENVRAGRPAAMSTAEVAQVWLSADSGLWMGLNRSKRSLAIDIRQEKGREVVLKLAKGADVIVQNFRPGVMDRLGLGYEDISKLNPRIIYCSQTGFGELGPMAHRIGGDMYAQAMGGIVSAQGSPNGPPYLCGFYAVDQTTAAITAFGIMLALFVREKTGIGQEVKTNLLHGALQMQTSEICTYLIDGVDYNKVGRGVGRFPPMGAYRAKDGDVVTIFGTGPAWPTFCKLLGIEHLEKDPRFDTDFNRLAHRDELYPLLDEAFSKKTRAEWQQIFREARMRCDPCLTYEEMVVHPQIEANEMIITQQHPVRGEIRSIGIPVKLTETPGKPRLPPPLLGQHTEEILTELGYSPEEIEQLIAMNIVRVAPQP